MKTRGVIAMVLVVVLTVGLVPAAMAALITLEAGSEKVVYDAVNQKYWYWDVQNWAGGKTYQDQIDQIDSELGAGYWGVTGWHMATAAERDIWSGYSREVDLIPTFGYQMYGPTKTYTLGRFNSNQTAYPNVHDTGTFNTTSPSSVISWTDDSKTYLDIGAWVVADASSSVPIPSAIWFLGSGLIGILGLRRNPKK